MPKKPLPVLPNVRIEGMSSEGKGIARVDGKVIFTPYAVPGDLSDLQIQKSRKNFAEATVKTIHEYSPLRETPVCSHFGVCGGCKWQHILYPEQLKFKQQIVKDAFEKIGKLDIPEVPEVLGSAVNYYYRNKLEFAFTDRRWLTEEEINSGFDFHERRGLGFHVPGSFSGVIDIQRCYLQADHSNAIRTGLKKFALENDFSFFNVKEQKGFLRNLLIRNTSIGELLVLVSFFENDEEKIENTMNFLSENFPEITSLQFVVNSKKNDTIYDLPVNVYKGKDHIIEKLGDYKFRIGPKSFFQTNSLQAKELYDITKDFAGLSGKENVYDLYTGVGSIALYVSGAAKSVTGVEQIEAAIEDAKLNASLNNVTNSRFYAGDVKMVLQNEFVAQNGKPDVVITDPPRAGMHEDVVQTLLQLKAPKVVYVSCNPSTQARDLSLMADVYQVKKIQPVDMFPHTSHIENVVQLVLRDS